MRWLLLLAEVIFTVHVQGARVVVDSPLIKIPTATRPDKSSLANFVAADRQRVKDISERFRMRSKRSTTLDVPIANQAVRIALGIDSLRLNLVV